MPLVGRPKLAKTLPQALPTDSVTALLATLHSDSVPRRRSDWIERDRALILTGLLAGLRADELLRANVGDLRRTDDGAVVPCPRQGRPGPPDAYRTGAGLLACLWLVLTNFTLVTGGSAALSTVLAAIPLAGLLVGAVLWRPAQSMSDTGPS